MNTNRIFQEYFGCDVFVDNRRYKWTLLDAYSVLVSAGSMGRWVDGSMGRWVDGSMGRWVDGSMGRWVDGYIKARLGYICEMADRAQLRGHVSDFTAFFIRSRIRRVLWANLTGVGPV
ncbi:hypothetical protein DKT77_04975 [Meridianimarinicoccus roseus]|uniref:Uncharacterized protein n=1 Tax=Meridianimarinicoccus roseus TaxID=2072018 RepID=A0A2V2LKG5_9RHOB|nr:hypothetical protein DKT77_04975 [Meridianimarinicoccus roseus]